MTAPIQYRTEARSTDATAVREMVRATGFFSEEEIAIAGELIDDRISNGESSHYQFVFAESSKGETAGYACFGRIAGTDRSFDLYWIVVHPNHQRSGVGRQVLSECERLIAVASNNTSARVYVETSSRAQYEPTRAFYLRCGYRIEATLEDFYSTGDGKVILVKAI